MNEPVSVLSLLERDPITGQLLKRSGESLTPGTIWGLLFADGVEAWKGLTDAEKDSFTASIRTEWETAKQNNRTAAAFFGNVLINIHTIGMPMHGEMSV